MIKLHKPVAREVAAQDGTALVATMTEAGVQIRAKGARKFTTIPYSLDGILAGARTVETEHGRKLVVRLTADGVAIREAGTMKEFLLPYGVAFVRAATLEAERLRAASGKARKVKVKRGVL